MHFFFYNPRFIGIEDSYLCYKFSTYANTCDLSYFIFNQYSQLKSYNKKNKVIYYN